MADFSVTTTNSDTFPATKNIVISGGMTIHYAEEILVAMKAALGESEGLQLDLANVTEFDLAGLQLLCSSHRTAVASGKRFAVIACTEILKSSAEAGGFSRHIGCRHNLDKACIWSGGAS